MDRYTLSLVDKVAVYERETFSLPNTAYVRTSATIGTFFFFFPLVSFPPDASFHASERLWLEAFEIWNA